MPSTSFTVAGADGTPLHAQRWLPAGDPKAAVQISHGMAEHSDRYARLAEALTAAGYAVYAADHRGHGRTAARDADLGFFADHDGWGTAVADMAAVTRLIHDEQPDRPVFLVAHSMGSMLTRSYLIRHAGDVDGAVLSGTSGSQGALGSVGRGIALAQARLRGRRHPSKLMDTLTFGQFNAAFKPARTGFDWLSRDPAEVDKYVADPRCGFVCSAGFYADLLGGLAEINDPKQVARISPDVPIYVFSGERDPVGGKNAGAVRTVVQQLRAAGVRDVTERYYPDGRHESFNEVNRDEVTADTIAWLDAHVR